MKDKNILLGHGSGGTLTRELIRDLFVRYFNNPLLSSQTDSSVLEVNSENIAFTTDAFVVSPIFFPGGNIGKLAVCGTVNDLAVSGAKPLYLSCSFIIEEGLPIEELEQVVASMAEEARKAGVAIVTGDTKVVDKGKCDRLFISTSGIGKIDAQNKGISTATGIKPGDLILINGNIAEHGLAVMLARNELHFRSDIASDCASLNHLIERVMKASDNIRFMRDATRGGLSSVLCELAEDKNIGIELEEKDIPLTENCRGLCELLGFDPLYVANEGKVVVVVDASDAEAVLEAMKNDELGRNASIIGRITDAHPGKVYMNTEIGGKRIVDMLAGEQLPRIC